MTDSEESDESETEVMINPFDIADTDLVANSKYEPENSNIYRGIRDSKESENTDEDE